MRPGGRLQMRSERPRRASGLEAMMQVCLPGRAEPLSGRGPGGGVRARVYLELVG